MSIEIISKHIIALALGAILAVLAWPVVAAQQTPLTPVAQPPEVKEPAAVGLTVDILKARMAGAEASKDMSEADKKSVISYLEAGVRLLEETDSLSGEAQKITETVTAAPQRIKEIQAQLNIKEPDFSEADIEAEASQMTTAQIEQREREKTAGLATARDTLKDWREQLEKLKNRPSQLQTEITQNKQKLAELTDELKKEASPNEPQELFWAKEAAIIAEQTMRSAKIRLFETQLLNNDLLVTLMTAEQDLATLQLQRNESESKAWRSIAGKRREQEAVKARMEAETATQKAASSDGRSPATILTTTFSDELSSLTAGKAKVFGISVKDRGAVSMAGHSGKAFWFSKSTNEFVTSSYYYKKYPQWVVDWNAKKLPEQYSGKAWELMHPEDTYLFGDRDTQEWEFDLAGYGRTFPHKFGTTDNKYFSTYLTVSPVGDELTVEFTKAAIDAEQIGSDDITDFLGVSFSATDYIGHFFGPSSLESEDNILRLDRTLANLFAFIDKKIGLDNTLIVLSADHGGPEAPGYLNSMGIPTGYVSPDSWDKQPAIDRIKSKFGVSGKLIEGYDHPYLYLSNEVISNSEIDLFALEAAIVDELVRFPGVSTAFSSTALARGAVPDNYLTRAITNNYHPRRSGNVYVVFDPGWFINDLDGLSAAVVHGSPWPYDTFVPIIFAGHNIKPQTSSRRVHTIDVAPTLSNIVGAKPPSGASGEVLLEVLGQKP